MNGTILSTEYPVIGHTYGRIEYQYDVNGTEIGQTIVDEEVEREQVVEGVEVRRGLSKSRFPSG